MEIPVIDLEELNNGDKRIQVMSLLHEACQEWGFFMVESHGVDKDLMERVKQLVNLQYEESMKEEFYNSQVAQNLEEKKNKQLINEDDTTCWESSFFIWHRPTSNVNGIPNLSQELRNTMDEYINQLIKLAEKLSQLMCLNLGLDKSYIKDAFSGGGGPSVGTKVAKYPKCPHPELVKGLPEHTDAGGIILLLQDDEIPGLQFLKHGKWIDIPPSPKGVIFVNTGDQLEILSNGQYKSAVHRVVASDKGSRLSIATFYNPSADAVISSATELLYPIGYRFGDYLNLYSSTKFGDKGRRFESMKEILANN